MREFRFNKLVRDDVAKSVTESGGNVNTRTLNDQEFLSEIKKKLLEEVQELLVAKGEKLEEELSDVQEIMDLICKIESISSAKLKKVRMEKIAKAGAFEKKIYIESVEVPNNSKWVDYYLANPDRYPEIR
jgi:predicted house-cleaning noncanonical NTP pyrophosphatase (MazG superfamily)